jgi:4-alpha-glucanotransferase
MGSVTDHRTSGVLLHPTSFPGGPVGTLGGEALRWIDWLREAGQGLWQVLPLVAVDEGGSPYNGLSAMAGNTLLLDAGRLVEDGWLPEAPPQPDPACADFAAAARASDQLLEAARAELARSPDRRAAFEEYRAREGYWLDDYALFRALRERHGGQGWISWPAELRGRVPAALEAARGELAPAVERHALGQLLFDQQWAAVRAAAGRAGIRVIGDIPIFVAHDSADVWAHPELFQLDAEGHSTRVSGVPPDYFSATGQLWGNPLYDWDAMRADGFRWWSERFRRTLALVDLARIDHFRGFESYWEVAAGEETAIHGRWMPGPGAELFQAVSAALGPLPLIAEDLGIITPQVEALRDALALPGMRVLQFAFGDDAANPHLPANHPHDTVAYTGTHDNDTALGWWHSGATEQERAGLRRLTDATAAEMNWGMVETVFRSPAAFAVIPLQDVLGLGSEGRMNVPGVAEGNWKWRYRRGDLTPERAARLRHLTQATGRSPWTAQTSP